MEPAARQTFAHNRKEEPRPQVTVCALRRSRRSLPAFRQTDHKGLRSREPLGDGTAKGGMEDDRKAVIHAVISSHEGWYVAECLEVAVVTQGRSLDEALANLRSALELRLSDERLARAGLSSSPQPDRELRVSGLHDLMPRLRRGTEKPRWFRLCVVSMRGSRAKMVRVTQAGEWQVSTVSMHSQVAIGTRRAIDRQAARYIADGEFRSKFFSD